MNLQAMCLAETSGPNNQVNVLPPKYAVTQSTLNSHLRSSPPMYPSYMCPSHLYPSNLYPYLVLIDLSVLHSGLRDPAFALLNGPLDPVVELMQRRSGHLGSSRSKIYALITLMIRPVFAS